MADPTPYSPSYDFSDFQDSHPNQPLPGNRVDIELANIATATSGAVNAVKDVRRSDGKLKNEIVTLDTLDPTVKKLLGVNSADLQIVADNIDDVVAVAGDIDNIDAVAGDLTNINSVAGDLTNVNAVAGDLTNINSVAGDLTNINAASGYAAAAGASATAAAGSATAAASSATAAAGSATAAAASATSASSSLTSAQALLAGLNSLWQAVLSTTTAVAAWVQLTVMGYVSSTSALALLSITNGQVVFLSAAGREGPFKGATSSVAASLLGAAIVSSAVDSTTETITHVAHGLVTGDAVIVTAAVDGLSTNTLYYVIRVDADNFKLASTFADAAAGTAFNLTGTTAVTVKKHFDAQQGIYVTPTTDITGASGAWVRVYGVGLRPEWFGAKRDGSTDDAATINACLSYAGTTGESMLLSSGTYKVLANLSVPVGTYTVDVIGEGWQNTLVAFSGSSVTKGFYFNGSGYSRSGRIRDLKITGSVTAIHGIYFKDLNHPVCERTEISGFNGAGIVYDSTLMGVFSRCLVLNCGNATEGQVMVDNIAGLGSTTFRWDHSRISGPSGGVAAGGLMIDDTDNISIISGAIESTNTPLLFSSKTGRSHGVRGGTILGIDLENPGNGNPYLDFGSGWTTNNAVYGLNIDACSGSPSSTTSIPKGAKLTFCNGLSFGPNCNWSQPTSGAVATYSLEGTGNLLILIAPTNALFGNAWPWVTVNSVWRKDAGPRVYFNLNGISAGITGNSPNFSGTTHSVLYSSLQGGYYTQALIFNASATTLSTLTDGVDGEVVTLIATNGNTTLAHTTSTADGFTMLSGANVVMVANVPYTFHRYLNIWRQF